MRADPYFNLRNANVRANAQSSASLKSTHLELFTRPGITLFPMSEFGALAVGRPLLLRHFGAGIERFVGLGGLTLAAGPRGATNCSYVTEVRGIVSLRSGRLARPMTLSSITGTGPPVMSSPPLPPPCRVEVILLSTASNRAERAVLPTLLPALRVRDRQ